MVASKIEVLVRWHEAVNDGEVDAAVGLCAEDVEVGGPRGTGQGRMRMRAWLERTGISLEPQEPFVETDGQFVVRELARWRNAADAPAGAPVAAPEETWVRFVVGDGLLRSVARFERREDVPDRPGAGLSEVHNLGDGNLVYPDQATAGYPATESGEATEGTAGPNARPRDDSPR